MPRSLWFVPGRFAPPQGTLARYRPPQPAGAAVAYVEQLTRPGDVVLALFCHGPLLLREIVETGRRAVGISFNLVNLLIAGLGLEQPAESTQLKVGLTRLADSPKGDVLLQHHVRSLYRTRCPTCGGEAMAEWFAWDREGRYPYEKSARCSRCGPMQNGPADEADIEAARRMNPRGLAYYTALNRVAPEEHPARERAAELVDLYTPRNLSALMDVAQRLEGLDLERRVRAALQGVMLEAFDRGSSLDPPDEARHRPRTLRPPSRFLERNVWLLIEEALDSLIEEQAQVQPLRRAADLAALLDDTTPGYTLVPSVARKVGDILPPGRLSLVLADPPRPDGVYWALCALWAGWLWDTASAHAMRPLLRRRRFDWAWHQEVLQEAMIAAAPLQAPDGTMVMLFAEADPGLVESACLALSGAGYDLRGWGISPGEGVRLAARAANPVAAPSPPTEKELANAAGRLARACLHQRAEPTPRPVLHAAIYAGLCGSDGYLAHAAAALGAPGTAERAPAALDLVVEGVRRGLDDLGLQQVDEAADMWLPDVAREAPGEPLADRVEEVVWRTLRSRPTWTVEELVWAVYAVLDGPLTPPLSLVLTCIDSYGVEVDGQRCLRREDDPSRRGQELRDLRRNLQTLGERLGFQVKGGRGWDVRWREEKEDAFLFAVSPTASLGRYLLHGPTISKGARPCLVFPGGRAELLLYKLRRDPRMAAAGEQWEFIKFRHVRRLITEELNRHLFEAVLGLDPVVEGEDVQIPLILGGQT